RRSIALTQRGRAATKRQGSIYGVVLPQRITFLRGAQRISSTETVWCRMLAPAEELVNIWQHVIAHSAAYEPRSGLPYVCSTKQMVVPNDVVGECRQTRN